LALAGNRLVEAGAWAGGERDRCPRLEQRFGHCRSKAARGAGDDRADAP
jgi:hypothetical protein